MDLSISNFRYTSLPSDALKQQTIRLLELHPANDASTAIKCSLVVASLHQGLGYEALSYCWGDASSKLTVVCNGQRLAITTSLHLALQHLRDATKPRTLWVDAICINQGDDGIVERTGQVQLMRHIYQKAQRVVIWLGEAHSNSHLAMDLFKRIVAAKQKLEAVDNMPYFSQEFLDHNGLPKNRWNAEGEAWLALRPFFQRPWFRRIWWVCYMPKSTNH